MTDALARLIVWYENLSPSSLEQIGSYYRDDAQFHDPFNAVQGVEKIKAILGEMFTRLDQARFLVEDRFFADGQGFINWRFLFIIGGKPTQIEGSTYLRFADDGRICLHRDYWDAAELYENLPVLGWLLKRLRSRFSSH